MRTTSPILALLLAAGILSCRDSIAPPYGLTGDDTPVMIVTPSQPLLGIGDEVELAAAHVGSSGQRAVDGIEWSTSDSSIVALRPGRVFPWAIGVREGNALVTASRAGVRASVPVTVRGSASPIVIDDFHLVEDFYPTEPATWAYAPKLRLRVPEERPAEAILAWEVTMPGIDGTRGCRSNVALAPLMTLVMFNESYGDYAVQFGTGPVRMSPDALALIRVTVRAADGATIVVSARGPTVRSTSPPAYQGLLVAGVCLFP